MGADEQDSSAPRSEATTTPAELVRQDSGSMPEEEPSAALAEIQGPSGGSMAESGTGASLAERRSPPSTVVRQRLASEDVIINAPMSFAGAFQRTMRLRRKGGLNKKPWYVQALWHWVVLNALLIVWWAAIAVWYVVFGILLVPYRLLRRGARKRKAEALRHREVLDALDRTE